jgi:eukaryotic-like serine/threonine-protein kinase
MRFGPYHLDSAGRELSKNGLRLKISGQPLQVLGLLLERPGTAVTRKEFFDQLWPSDTFVDFDHSLNTAIKRLRRALEDDPEHPTYIETIPKYGYRFIGVVDQCNTAVDAIGSVEPGTQRELRVGDARPGLETRAHSPTLELKADGSTPTRNPLNLPDRVPSPTSQMLEKTSGFFSQMPFKHWMWVTVGGFFAFLAVAAGFIAMRSRADQPALTQKDSVLLADFQNSTGEPVFDSTLGNALAIELGQSPFLDIVSRDRNREILRLMGHSPDQPILPSLAREVCQRAGAQTVIDGSVTRLGNNYVVALQAQNCRDGRTFAHEQIAVESREDVLRVLGQISARLRQILGESVASVHAFDIPLEQVTTVSLEALKAYSIGVDQLTRGEESKAILLFEHAAELDPGFAMAYTQLGIEYNNLGESKKASAYLRKAYALRDHLSEREKLFLTVRYDMVVVGDTDKATQTAEMWTQIYPRDWRPFNTLSARYQVSGEYEKAAVAAEEALRLQPDHYLPYANLARSYLALGRFNDARRVAESAQTRHRDSLDTHEVLFDLAFLKGDHEGMQRELQWGTSSSRSNDMLSTEAFAEAASGHLKSALSIFRRSWEADHRLGDNDDEAYSMAGAAVFQADVGKIPEARLLAEEALKHGQGIDAEETAAQALALSGGERRARLIASDLHQRFPLHTVLNSASLPAILGSIDVRTGNPEHALDILQSAVPYDYCEFANLAPVYIRAKALLKLGKGHEAVAEFQKIVDHPGIDVTSPRHVLARLGIARALALSGERLAARKAYEQFFELWLDADEEIPELRNAKLEYAKLELTTEPRVK